MNRCLIAMIGITMLTTAMTHAVTLSSADHQAIVPNRAPLEVTPFIRLPIGSVHAQGWLLKQLQLQKAGLTGSAENLYDALTPDSGWLGGKGEGWEKGPYYVKGLIALAHTLDDDELKQRAQKWIDWALTSQHPDGSFGPASNDDWWPRMVVLFYLRDHYEATGDARVVPFLLNYFHYQLITLPARPLRDWGRARAADNIDVVLWVYNLTGDVSLLDLAKLLREQALPWPEVFTNNEFYGRFDDFHSHHIVNVCQALKFPAVAWQFTHEKSDRDALGLGIANLNRQYGRIDGQFSGTEMLSGLKSTDGVELCADIEHIISNGIGATIFGDPALADQMEKVAYNSLPAHTTPLMRQITYYQLVNQVSAVHGGHGFTEDYPNGNVPGPYSGYPCCCYNWHAGWPKFVQQMWAATSDHGLAAIAYGPNVVTSVVADDVPISISQKTDYPFGETITLHITPKHAVTFPLLLRVPAWCKSPTISVNGSAVSDVKTGSFVRIVREWKTDDRVEIKFPMEVRTSKWTNGSVGIERGPLAFGLRISEQWNRVHEYANKFDEFEVVAHSPWNYALQIDGDSPKTTVKVQSISSVPFDTNWPPITLTMQARRVPSWGAKTLPGVVEMGRSNNAWQSMGTASAALEPGVPHHLRVEAKGKMLNVFVDDFKHAVMQREDSTFASGSIGLRTYETAAGFDDVKLNGEIISNFDKGGADAWQVVSGNWNVRDGAFAADSARDGKALLKSHADLRDFVLEATVTVAAGGNAGVIFRASDLNSNLDGYHGYYVGLAAREGKSEDAAEPPMSPVNSDQPLESIELIPFGSAKLRVCYFPVLK